MLIVLLLWATAALICFVFKCLLLLFCAKGILDFYNGDESWSISASGEVHHITKKLDKVSILERIDGLTKRNREVVCPSLVPFCQRHLPFLLFVFSLKLVFRWLKLKLRLKPKLLQQLRLLQRSKPAASSNSWKSLIFRTTSHNSCKEHARIVVVISRAISRCLQQRKNFG
jgi:hypothetical protein